MDTLLYTRLNECGTLKNLFNDSYWDKIGKCWTIGVGCVGSNIVKGTHFTDSEVLSLYASRHSIAEHGAEKDIGSDVWQGLNDVRQAALTDMAFQIGIVGLSEFIHLIGAVRAGDWIGAKREVLNSRQATQTPLRAERNANMLLTGKWQPGYGA